MNPPALLNCEIEQGVMITLKFVGFVNVWLMKTHKLQNDFQYLIFCASEHYWEQSSVSRFNNEMFWYPRPWSAVKWRTSVYPLLFQALCLSLSPLLSFLSS